MDQPLQTYDVGQEITLRGLFLTGATIGTILKSQTLLLVQDSSALTLTGGSPIFVQGAGAVGGDLRTTVVSSSAAGIVLADAALSDARLALVGTPTDPTAVTCKVSLPDGTESTISASGVVTGRWEATFTPTLDGDHYYRFTGTGAATADAWRKFTVRPERVP
jgi:hypothetical protein